MIPVRRAAAAYLLPLALLSAPADAEVERYRVPSAAVRERVALDPIPEAAPSPDGAWLVLQHRPPVSAADLAVEPLRLAGLLVDPATGNWAHEPGARLFKTITGFTLVRTADGSRRPLRGLPPAGMSGPLWSHDGARFAFLHYTAAGTELWVADVATARARRIPGANINEAAPSIRGFAPGGFRACLWMADSIRLLCLTVPESRPASPSAPDAAAGPSVSVSERANVVRANYLYDTQVLRDARDDALFRHFMTSQPEIIDSAAGTRRPFGPPAIYLKLVPSPDESVFLVERVEGDLPRHVPYNQFAHATELLAPEGALLRRLADPVAPTARLRGIADVHRGTRPRDFLWRPDRPAALTWSQRIDGVDRLIQAEGPAFASTTELLRVEGRINSNFHFGGWGAWTDDGRALVQELAADSAAQRTWLLDVRGAAPTARLLPDPLGLARPMRAPHRNALALRRDGDWIAYETIERPSGAGTQHRLDRLNLATLERQILFRPAPAHLETVLGLADSGRSLLLTSESADLPPEVAIQQLASGRRRLLTDVRHERRYFSLATDEQVELHFQRPDGIRFGGDLFLPRARDRRRPLPLLIWTYPAVGAADTRATRFAALAASGAPFRFRGLTAGGDANDWIRAITAAGYGLLFLDMPIVGGGNDRDDWIDQVRMNADAAVARLAASGLAEPGRIAIGGHSYGGMTAGLLLASTDLFAAGISIGGGYDTHDFPFGFAGESRNFWSARAAYDQQSLFRAADRIDEPFLMIHGGRDSNLLTPLEGARAMFGALYGLGRPARLVVQPVESHHPVSREAVLDTLAEIISWLDAHLGGAAGESVRRDDQRRANE